ncbi:MAG: hypothetical protein A3G79_00635 [Gallionellales bacterium RIFCSPLOWO2_12_FULL_57_18]|nr:MAG: hypothetical protein A3G79_00635 [Gallionellales bacterium RIFCSPLOWO2_12_FULL_57_18]OGS96379.1 MAG: hypothetical protein A3H31_07675 [Gallionellales bacterium RIFCSPLOWO2_02_FULL_57_47]
MKIFYLGILAVLWLTGCASHVHQLVREDGVPFIAGELVHDSGEGNRLVLEAPNRRYQARGFAVERQTNLADLRKRYYGVNPKHWDRIFSGLDTDHVTLAVETVARDNDGVEVSCRFVWISGAKPEGVCTDQAGAEFLVRFD